MKSPIYYFIILMSFYSCENEIPDLNGHWHLEYEGKDNEYNLTESWPTIDIREDTLAIIGLNVYGYGGIGGGLSYKENRMRFGAECLVIDFKYSFDGEKLHLLEEFEDTVDDEDIYKYTYYTAYRCDSICCDKQREFFFGTNVEIDLPVLKSLKDTVDINYSLQNPIFFGKPIATWQPSYGTNYKMVLGRRFGKLEDIDLWEEKHKIKVPEHNWSEIKKIIYADRMTPMAVILPFIEKYIDRGDDKFYFATKESNMNKKLQIEIKTIDFTKIDLMKIREFTIEKVLNDY